MSTRKLFPKLARDWAVVAAMMLFLTFNYYTMRRIDPGATVDGLAGIYNAMQIIVIAFASASLAATIRWLLFYPLRRTEEERLFECGRWVTLATVLLDRGTWFIIWIVIFWAAI